MDHCGAQQNVRRRNEHKRTAVKQRTSVANSLFTGTSANQAPASEQPTAQDIFTACESHFLSLTAKSDKKSSFFWEQAAMLPPKKVAPFI